jgi:glutaminyl-peptide cyclotransferase
VPSVDLIDLEYPNAMNPGGYWHTAGDTVEHCSPKSLQAVGDVLLAALPAIEMRVSGPR